MPQTRYAEAIKRIQTLWLFVRWLCFFSLFFAPSLLLSSFFSRGRNVTWCKAWQLEQDQAPFSDSPGSASRGWEWRESASATRSDNYKSIKIQPIQYPEKSLPFQFLHIYKINDDSKYVEELPFQATTQPVRSAATFRIYSTLFSSLWTSWFVVISSIETQHFPLNRIDRLLVSHAGFLMVKKRAILITTNCSMLVSVTYQSSFSVC